MTPKKSQIKVSTFLIAIALTGLFITYFVTFISSASISYGGSFDNTSLSSMNKVEHIINYTEEIRDRATAIKTQNNLLDIVGGYFNDAYATLRLAVESIGVFDDMTNTAISQLPLGSLGAVTKTVITGIVVLLLIIGVLLSAIVKKEL